MEYSNTAKVIRSALASKGESAAFIAAELGCALSTAYNWLGSTVPHRREVPRIASILGIPEGRLEKAAAGDRKARLRPRGRPLAGIEKARVHAKHSTSRGRA